MTLNEARTFDLPRPGDPSRTLQVEATLTGLARYFLPDLDDALAQTVGDFETLEDLKSKIREDLAAHLRRQYDAEYAQRALKALVEQAEVEFPPQMLEEEIDNLIEDLKNTLRRRGQDLESYLKERNQTPEALREELRPQAERRIRQGLVLYQLAQEEGLSVPEEELEEEARTVLRQVQASEEAWQRLKPTVMARLRSRLLLNRALERLVVIAHGEAAPLAMAEANSAPEPEAGEAVPSSMGPSDST
jgi:trigger factor